MSGVFVNYRKGDHTGTVEALHWELVRHFGQSQVFLDMPSIPLGDRYPDAIRQRVQACEVLLVVIHAEWLTRVDEQGTRLIDRERDWVREEIEIALKAGKPVLPVLLGEARPPLAKDLPESIRDLALRQVHRIRQGSFGPDVEQLISKLEQHVAPTWLPPTTSAPSARRVPVRWLAGVTAVLAAALLVLPPIRMVNVGDPSDPDLLSDVIGLGSVSIFFMAVPLVAHAAAFGLYYPLYRLFRAKIDSVEREIHTVSVARFNRFTIPLALLWFLFGTALIVAMTDDWRTWLPIALGSFVVIFAILGYSMMRDEKHDEEARTNWPQPLPSPFRPSAHADFRRVVAQFRARIAGWKSPLSREQRDKSWWVLARLSDAVDELHAQARQSRLRWLTTDHPWLACVYTVWIAGTMGLVLEATFPKIYWGTARFSHYAAPVVFALVIGLVCAGTVELGYRYKRWYHWMRLAAEVQENIAELSERLLLDGLDHLPWDYGGEANG